MRRDLLIRGLLFVAALLSLGGLGAPTDAQEEPLLGYATGPDRIAILNLDDFSREGTAIGPPSVRFLSSAPKFGPGGKLYISDSDSGNLHIFDPQAQEFVDAIPLESEPNDFELRGHIALVNDFSGDRIQIVDVAEKRILDEVAVDGPAANEIALSPDGSRAYVTTFDYEQRVPYQTSHPLVVYDVGEVEEGLQLQHVKTIPLERAFDGEAIPYVASSVAVSSDGRRVYTLALNDFAEEPTVFLVDAESLEVTESVLIDLGLRARDPFVNFLALSPDDRTLGISAFRNGLALIDLETQELKVVKPEGPRLTDPSVYGVTFGPQSEVVYAIGIVGRGELGFVAAFDVQTGEQLNVISLRRQPLLFMAVPGGTTF